MTPAEWDALAWWQQKMYFDGYVWEGLIERTSAGSDSTVVAERVHHSGGSRITERKHEATFGLQPGEMSAFGIPETMI